ncbi:MAG: hypothetical protein U9Q00_01630 [Synergistota bacterium]|nr:hypothetical protein [Synergistota bacterium]
MGRDSPTDSLAGKADAMSGTMRMAVPGRADLESPAISPDRAIANI